MTMTDDALETLGEDIAKAQTWDELTPLIGFAKRAGELALRVKRKAGALLAKAAKGQGGRPKKTPVTPRGVSEYRRMRERWEFSEPTAQRWQRLAAVCDDDDFEAYIKQAKADEADITEDGLLRHVKAAEETEAERAVKKGLTLPQDAVRNMFESALRRARKGYLSRGGERGVADKVLREDCGRLGNRVADRAVPTSEWPEPAVELSA